MMNWNIVLIMSHSSETGGCSHVFRIIAFEVAAPPYFGTHFLTLVIICNIDPCNLFE